MNTKWAPRRADENFARMIFLAGFVNYVRFGGLCEREPLDVKNPGIGMHGSVQHAVGATAAGCMAGALFCMQQSAWAVTVQGTNFSAGPVAPNTPLVLNLDQFPAPGEGSLALMIGTQDVTGMIRGMGEKQITYPAHEYPIQPGPRLWGSAVIRP